jgi:hypothetical protein
MRDLRRIAVVVPTFAFLVAFALPLTAAEFEEGRIRLTLHEDVGRFTVSYLRDLRTDEYIPLFFARDPRTSVISVTEAGQVHRLGDAGVFTLRTETDRKEPAFVFTSGTLEVRQSFSFVSSPNARLVNGVKMTLSVTNVSESAREVALRILLDTHLSENDDVHFITANGTPIEGEQSIRPSASNAFFASLSDQYEGVGLQYMVSGSATTSPERVVFANWKRLSDSRFSYSVEAGRNFSLLPYSINDSAAAIYYAGRTLDPGQSRTITTFVGNYDEAGFGPAGQRSDLAGMLDSEGEEEDLTTTDALLKEVLAVNEVVEEIDRLLANPEEASQEDLELINRLLDELEARKNAISDQ